MARIRVRRNHFIREREVARDQSEIELQRHDAGAAFVPEYRKRRLLPADSQDRRATPGGAKAFAAAMVLLACSGLALGASGSLPVAFVWAVPMGIGGAGFLAVTNGVMQPRTPAAMSLLPDTHIAVVRADRAGHQLAGGPLGLGHQTKLGAHSIRSAWANFKIWAQKL